MTPGKIVALIRDTVVVAGLLTIGWLIYRGGEDRVKAGDLKALQKQIAAQAQIVDTWHTEALHANDKLNQTVASINAAPVVVHDWVRQPACRPAVLPAAASQASAPRPDTAGIQPERRGDAEADRRDAAVAEFKVKWSTELATCQSFLDQWPQ